MYVCVYIYIYDHKLAKEKRKKKNEKSLTGMKNVANRTKMLKTKITLETFLSVLEIKKN